MDRILPEDVTRVILLDVDLFFSTDIKLLFDQFENFKNTTKPNTKKHCLLPRV